LSEHGDVIETKEIILYLSDMHNNMHITQNLSSKFSSKLDPWSRVAEGITRRLIHRLAGQNKHSCA